MLPPIPFKYMLPLTGLAVSAFVFNTSEFMPIGLLTDISDSFGMTPAATGIMITVYAWVVGILSLPLMLATCRMELKRLLLLTLALFALGQAGSGLAVNFPMLMGARILVACAHSIFWSIAAPLATRLVTRTHQPFALSTIATGSSVAMIFGLPLGRVVGLALGWRMTFLVLAVISTLALLYLWRVFPSLTNNSTFSTRDLPALVRNPLVSGIFVLSVLFATAYFTTYSYIEPFLGTIAGFAPDAITWTLMVLGVCGFFGSVLFSRFYGRHRFPIFRAGLLGLLVALMCFLPSAAFMPSMIACCMLLGTISTLFNVTMQAELIRNCSLAAAPVAMSIFSGIFNVGIGGGTFIGGRLAAASLLPDIGFVGAAIAACAVLFGLLFYLPHARRQSKQEKVK
ncbi:MFS transporter [Mitsuokella sp. AF21-1AC]|uniref:MFS transporter n=1 Tax=Mitsuokella sp. AF21-1AC TaxID=2292235 RepID=UPI000E4A105D|nr:MFS transporter [Mitsuokella sp. AF21-1AC]RGS72152.1 MFS transporter [Mitsuokella sp. AF21-1AC]